MKEMEKWIASLKLTCVKYGISAYRAMLTRPQIIGSEPLECFRVFCLVKQWHRVSGPNRINRTAFGNTRIGVECRSVSARYPMPCHSVLWYLCADCLLLCRKRVVEKRGWERIGETEWEEGWGVSVLWNTWLNTSLLHALSRSTPNSPTTLIVTRGLGRLEFVSIPSAKHEHHQIR